jgi:Family of unknown function (DUF5317)
MLILVVAVGGGLLAGLLCGGSLANLEHLSLRLWALVVLALLLQLVAFSPVGARAGATAVIAAHVVSYALLLVFVAANVRRAPVAVAGAGILLNTVAIVVNGGYMPATRRALELAGRLYPGQTSNNSELAGVGTHLLFLGDVFAVPAWMPLHNVFSVGDLLVAAGVGWLVGQTMRRPVLPVPA